MKARIFAQHRMGERGNQRPRRMAKREMPCRQINLSLPVEGVERGRADHPYIGGQIVTAPARPSGFAIPRKQLRHRHTGAMLPDDKGV